MNKVRLDFLCKQFQFRSVLDLKVKYLEIVMQKGNANYFAVASNMSQDQIQKLFSPVVPGNYVSNLVFSPSTNSQDSIFRAIEALREKNPSVVPQEVSLLVHG